MSKQVNKLDRQFFGSLMLGRVKLIGPLVLSVCILLVAVWFVIRPWLSDIQSKQTEISTLKTTITQLANKLGILAAQDDATLREYSLELSFALPREAYPANIFATLEQLVSESGLTLTSMQYAGLEVNQETKANSLVATTDASGSIKTQINVGGGYAQIVAMLKKLQAIRPLLSDISVDVTSTTTQVIESNGQVQNVLSDQASVSILAPFAGLVTELGETKAVVWELSKEDLALIELVKGYSIFNQAVDSDSGEQVQYNEGKLDPF